MSFERNMVDFGYMLRGLWLYDTPLSHSLSIISFRNSIFSFYLGYLFI